MSDAFTYEVLEDWNRAALLREEWDELYALSGIGHPFATFEWLDCWIGAFCRPGVLRLLAVRDAGGIRAIFPAYKTTVVRRGIHLKALSSAGNGHFPRFGVLSREGDLAAVSAALAYPFSPQWEEKIDLLSLVNVWESSLTALALKGLDLTDTHEHVEHTFESPAYRVGEGWERYFASRSGNFRHRFRQSLNHFGKLPDHRFEFVPLTGDASFVERLRAIDARTWQHENGSGLFSVPENAAFYEGICRKLPGSLDCYAGFLRAQGKDIAYELGFSQGRTAYLLKYGFDPEYSRCRPGVLVQHFLSEHLAGRGIEEIDLCGESTEEKAKWATHSRRHDNIWLLNKGSLLGRCATLGLSLLSWGKEAEKAAT